MVYLMSAFSGSNVIPGVEDHWNSIPALQLNSKLEYVWNPYQNTYGSTLYNTHGTTQWNPYGIPMEFKFGMLLES